MAKFELIKRKSGEFQFNLKASNGEVILTSEGYAAKDSCKKGIESVRKNSQKDENFERLTSSNGKYYFNLKAVNGKVVGTSEMYETEANRNNGIGSVKRNAPKADLMDVTKMK